MGSDGVLYSVSVASVASGMFDDITSTVWLLLVPSWAYEYALPAEGEWKCCISSRRLYKQ